MKINPINRLLLLCTGFTFSLIVFRVFYSGSPVYLFFVWNICLAGIPLLASSALIRARKKIVQFFLFSGWLLFFPNSLYIITDLVHLKQRALVPLWFDSILVFSAAMNGLIIAYVSLRQAELFLQKIFTQPATGLILCCCLFLGSFGVYLGRFLRWNSWDILMNPLGLSFEIGRQFIYPFQHSRTWAVTIILTLFFSIFYFTIKKLPGLITKQGK